MREGFLSVEMTLEGILLRINSIIPPPFLFRYKRNGSPNPSIKN